MVVELELELELDELLSDFDELLLSDLLELESDFVELDSELDDELSLEELSEEDEPGRESVR